MRIVHAVYSLEMGGAEMLVAQLCRIQRAQGHHVTVVAYSMLGTLGEELLREGLDVRVLGEAHPARTIWRYYKLFAMLQPDAVHCHNPAPTLQAAIGARLSGAASVIATRHSLVSPPYDRAEEIKFNLIALFLNWIVGICDITCNNLRGTPLVRKDRIRRVYNGSAPVNCIPGDSGRDPAHFTLLFVGRLAAIKELGTALQAVAEARKLVPGIRFWIVGDGQERATLEALAHSLGLHDVVTFMGQQLQTDQYFCSADLFVMSSRSEGLPMSLVQAMSAGLPACLTDVGGMQEIVRKYNTGLLSPVGDAASMAQNIVRLATSSELYRTMQERSRAVYEAEFTLQQMADGYMKLYREP